MNRSIAVLLIAALLLPISTPTAQGQAAHPFEQCSKIDSAALRIALQQATEPLIREEMSEFPIPSWVDRHWQRLGLSRVIDQEVDRSIEQLKRDASWWELPISGWSEGKATEFAETITRRTFDSEDLQQGIQAIAVAVTNDMTDRLAEISQRSSKSALQCVMSFIGSHYTDAIGLAFSHELSVSIGGTDRFSEFLRGSGKGPQISNEAIVGISLVVGAQIARVVGPVLAKKIRNQIASALVKRLGASLVPILNIAAIASLVLGIVKAIFNGSLLETLADIRQGALPHIAQELKSEKTEKILQDDVARVIGEEVRKKAPAMAGEIAQKIYGEWIGFRQRHQRVLDLADSEPRFSSFLETLFPQDFERLGRLVAALDGFLDDEDVRNTIADGSIERLFRLRTPGLTLLAQTASVNETLAWADLAPQRLAMVVHLGLHRLKKPEDFSSSRLDQLLALEDVLQIRRVAGLETSFMAVLLELSLDVVKPLMAGLGDEDLDILSWYVKKLDTSSRDLVLSRLAMEPRKITLLSRGNLQELILASAERDRMLAFVFDFSAELVEGWVDRAGSLLDEVLAFELVERGRPQDFGPGELERLFELDDVATIDKLIDLEPVALRAFLQMQPRDLRVLAAKYSVEDLGLLAWWVQNLDVEGRSALWTHLDQQPGALEILEQPKLRECVLNHEDRGLALGVFFASGFTGWLQNSGKLVTGDVTAALYFCKYALLPWILAGVAGVLLLALFRARGYRWRPRV